MSIATPSQTFELPLRKITAAEFERMASQGYFVENRRVELHEGKIVQMSPIGPDHMYATRFLLSFFSVLLPKHAIIDAAAGMIFEVDTEYQPDLAILKPSKDFYRKNRPIIKDVLILIEVADTSVTYDQNVKLPKYAECGIPVYWLVNVKKGTLTIYESPKAGKYTKQTVHTANETIKIKQFPKLTLDLSELLKAQ